jgi:hypothetical protein
MMPRRARLSWTRIVRDGVSVAGVIVFVWFSTGGWILGLDSYAYWNVDPAAPYHLTGDPTQIGAFLYSPAAAQVAGLFGRLPWAAFFWIWLGLLVAALAWLGRWWTLALFAFPPVVLSLWLGNIDILLAAAMVAGFRWPAAWAFVLLTKVTPGVGLLWFAVRREWRSLAIALGATVIIAGVSFSLMPRLWFEWPAALMTIDDRVFQPVPLALRLPLAALLVVWGARSDRRWTVVVAGVLAIPWISARSLAMLAGVIPLLGREAGRYPEGPAPVGLGPSGGRPGSRRG